MDISKHRGKRRSWRAWSGARGPGLVLGGPDPALGHSYSAGMNPNKQT